MKYNEDQMSDYGSEMLFNFFFAYGKMEAMDEVHCLASVCLCRARVCCSVLVSVFRFFLARYYCGL